MEIKRSEIMPGVNLAYLWSDKFKTSCMSLTLLTQLQRDTASMNALIPLVLRRGTTRYPDMEAISARLDELYGTAHPGIARCALHAVSLQLVHPMTGQTLQLCAPLPEDMQALIL